MSKYMKKCIEDYPHKFFFVHSTNANANGDEKTIPRIFESGYIHPGSKIHENLLGAHHNEVYFMICFPELKNIYLGGGDIIIKPEIICDYPILFSNDWNYGGDINNGHLFSIFFNSNKFKQLMEKIENNIYNGELRIGDLDYIPDTKKQLYEKLDRIFEEEKKYSSPFSHEFVIGTSISLKDYVIGVILDKNNSFIEKTKEIIKRKKYELIVKETDNYIDNLNRNRKKINKKLKKKSKK